MFQIAQNLLLKLNFAHIYNIRFFQSYDIILLMKRWTAMAQHLFVHNLQHNLTNVSLEQPRCSYIVDIIGESRVESNIHFYSTASSILSRLTTTTNQSLLFLARQL